MKLLILVSCFFWMTSLAWGKSFYFSTMEDGDSIEVHKYGKSSFIRSRHYYLFKKEEGTVMFSAYELPIQGSSDNNASDRILLGSKKLNKDEVYGLDNLLRSYRWPYPGKDQPEGIDGWVVLAFIEAGKRVRKESYRWPYGFRKDLKILDFIDLREQLNKTTE